MSQHKRPTAYNLVSKAIHWITALCIIGLLFVGYQMQTIPYGDFKFQLFGLHKSFGLLVLMLVVFRILWNRIKKKPHSLSSHRPWEIFLAHAAHGFLYAAMIFLPLSGWIMSSAGEFPVSFFGYSVPPLTGKNPELAKAAEQTHGILATALLVVLGLHILGAVKHHLLDRDKTILRMVSSSMGFKGGLVICALALAGYGIAFYAYAEKELFQPHYEVEHTEDVAEEVQSVTHDSEDHAQGDSAPQAQKWVILKDESALNFRATQYGTDFSGHFDFDGDIYFDLNNMQDNEVRIHIDITSINTGDDGRDSQAKGSDWFSVSEFPKAVFSARDFEKQGDEYIANGQLTLRGVTSDVSFPFTLTADEARDGVVKMAASFNLSRFTFGVGQGEWLSGDAIGENVAITIDLTAQRQ